MSNSALAQLQAKRSADNNRSNGKQQSDHFIRLVERGDESIQHCFFALDIPDAPQGVLEAIIADPSIADSLYGNEFLKAVYYMRKPKGENKSKIDLSALPKR